MAERKKRKVDKSYSKTLKGRTTRITKNKTVTSRNGKKVKVKSNVTSIKDVDKFGDYFTLKSKSVITPRKTVTKVFRDSGSGTTDNYYQKEKKSKETNNKLKSKVKKYGHVVSKKTVNKKTGGTKSKKL